MQRSVVWCLLAVVAAWGCGKNDEDEQHIWVPAGGEAGVPAFGGTGGGLPGVGGSATGGSPAGGGSPAAGSGGAPAGGGAGRGGQPAGGSGGHPSGGAAGESTAGASGSSGSSGHAGTGTGGTAGAAADTGGSSGTAGSGGSGGVAGGAAGAGGSDPFAGCPDSGAYVGNPAWTHHVIATENAIYCATFSEARTLKQELAAKAQLRIAPGTYALPDSGTEHAFGLPLCLLTTSGITDFNPGSADHSSSSYGERTTHRHPFTQTLTSDGRELQGDLAFDVAPGDPLELTLDGSHPSMMLATTWFTASLCNAAGECWGVDALVFDSCTHESSTLNTHSIELGSDHVELRLRIGQSMASTEPGAFVRAFGTFGGHAFDQTDYFKLVYRPEHHHFVRNFAVLFDTLIDGACGIEVSNVEPWYGTQASVVAYTVDCNLDRLQPLTVTRVTVPQP